MLKIIPHSSRAIALLYLLASAGAPAADSRPAFGAPACIGAYPLFVKTRDAAAIALQGGDVSLTGGASDPNRGTLGHGLDQAANIAATAKLRQAGIPFLPWYEAIGTAHGYVAAYATGPSGAVQADPKHPDLPWMRANAWSWLQHPKQKGTFTYGWVGIHNNFSPEPFLNPFAAVVRDPALPEPTDPQGRPLAAAPRAGRRVTDYPIYGGLGARDVFGAIAWSWTPLAGMDPAAYADKPGALEALIELPPSSSFPEDPGDPETSHAAGRYSGLFRLGLDPAAPFWAAYARRSLARTAQAGASGFWIDNFGMFDTFSQTPIRVAFGQWSVARFAQWLPTHPMGRTLAADPDWRAAEGDVSRYLRQTAGRWGGRMPRANAPVWRNPRWDDDPVWQAFKIFKRDLCADYLARLAQAARAAAGPGAAPLATIGNDPPMDFGASRDSLDITSKEISCGWSLLGGTRGILPPPIGSFAPVYKAMRQGTRYRTVCPWLYVAKNAPNKPNLVRALYYEALAHEASPAQPPGDNGHDYGTPEVLAEFNRFARRVREAARGLTAYEPIGIVFSAETQLAVMRPGGVPQFDLQPHLFSHWGWGEALLKQNIPYCVVPDWGLEGRLSGLKLLVLPQVAAISDTAATQLEEWIRAGGVAIVSGKLGARHGPNNLYAVRTTPRVKLLSLAASATPRPLRLGAGWVMALGRRDPGLDYFLADSAARRRDLAREIQNILLGLADTAGIPPSALIPCADSPADAEKSGMTFFTADNGWAVAIHNRDLRLREDALPPLSPRQLTLNLPGARASSPAPSPRVTLLQSDVTQSLPARWAAPGQLSISLPPIPHAAFLKIEF